MFDLSDITKRFSSRLVICFMTTIWAIINFTEISPYVFMLTFGIFAIMYTITKIFIKEIPPKEIVP